MIKKYIYIYITYLDKIIFYINAMSKSFPTGGFKWLDTAKFNLDKNMITVLEIAFKKSILKYPK